VDTIGKILKGSPTVVTPAATVLQAVEAMCKDRVGACAVVEAGVLKGVFTERDLMSKVVLKGLSPASVRVADVCTTQVITATTDTREGQALLTMLQKHIRHLAVVDADGKLVGMISLRKVLMHRVDDLELQLESLQAYISADGPGG
jgi:CBS domain-containing protein